MVSPANVVTWPYRAVRGAVVAFRLWRQLQADADARICLGFKRQQEILSERLREAEARGDTSEEQKARRLLHGVQDNELSYHQLRIADLAAHIVADRAPSGVISPDLPKLPEPEREGLDTAATALQALEPAQSVERHFLLGNAFYAAQDFESALQQYNAALELHPDDPDILNNRGNALFDLGRYEEANADYSRALEIHPDHPQVLNNRGAALIGLKRYDEALADYNRSLQLRPDHPDVLNNRGTVLSHLKGYEEALADFNRSLELRPDHADTMYNIACLYSLWERYDESLQWLEKAIARDASRRGMAAEDEDFAGLRADPEFGPRFEKLIEEEPS